MSKKLPIFKQKAYLSALALLEIMNHYARCEQDEIVLGIVLGNGNQIKSTIPLVASLEEGNIIIDRDLMSERLALEDELSTSQILGWYTFGDSEWRAQIHAEIDEECLDECLMLSIDMEKLSSSLKFPIECFLGVSYGLSENELDLAFVKIPLETQLDSSAHAGLQLIRDLSAETKPLQSDVESLKSSFLKVQDLLESLEKHVDAVVAGEKQAKEEEGQFLADSLACIPKIDLEAFKTVFKSHLQDLDLIAHLANLTKTQLDIASKLQAVLL